MYLHMSDLYIPRIRLPRTDGGNIKIAHRYMNVKIGIEAMQFHSGNIYFEFSVRCTYRYMVPLKVLKFSDKYNSVLDGITGDTAVAISMQ
jgi:hypothetical protein